GGFELADADGAAPGGVSALVAQWTAGAGLGEVGDATAVSAAAGGHAHPGGAGDGVVLGVDVEAVLAEAAGRRRRRLGPATRVDVLVVESLLELAGPIGGIAVDLGVLGAVLAVEEIVDEILRHRCVAGVARRDDRVGDDLAVGIDRDMTLVAVKAPGLG